MQKALFLDRDGVLNREIGDYAFRAEDFTINEGVIPFLQEMQSRKYLLIVISNQGGIGKGVCTQQDVENRHHWMKEQFNKSGINITEIYYCTHHPSTSKCFCRKPSGLMLQKAIARFNIDAQASYFIGDAERDMEAAINAGVRGIKITHNDNLNDYIHLIA